MNLAITRLHALPADVLGVVEVEGRAFVIAHGSQEDVLQLYPLCMADGEAPGWLDAVGRRFGIVGLAEFIGLAG